MINEPTNTALSNISSRTNNKSTRSYNVKNKTHKKNYTSKIYEVDNSKTGIDLSKFEKIKNKLICSYCGNSIMKSGLNFSCNHILCANCISRQILKTGINKIQNKSIEGILNFNCPCNEGNIEITIENLNPILYINEECISHTEFKSCKKCIMWVSELTKIKNCSIHKAGIPKNITANLIKDYCLDCQKEICDLCKEESHSGHSIKSIENIIKDIRKIKLKNKNFSEFLDFFKLIEIDYKKKYNKELNSNLEKINEAINLLNQIKTDFIEKMEQKNKYAKNLFMLVKNIYYLYYKDLATVQNNIKVIDFLFQNKYELQNITFNSEKNFSFKIYDIYETIKKLKIETFDFDLNIKNNFSNCTAEKLNAHDGYIFDLLNIDDKYLLSGGEDKKIKIWSLDKMNLFTRIDIDTLTHNSSIFSLCKQDQGKKFFSGSFGEIKIWSKEDFNLIYTLLGHNDYITHMEVFPRKVNSLIDQSYKDYLFSSSYDKTIKIWDIQKFLCVSTLSGHNDHINCFIQNEPGYLISCSSDKSIKFWNIDEEKCYLSLDDAHDRPIYSLTKTDDGKIVSSSFYNIKVYDIKKKKCDTIYSDKNQGVYKLVMLPFNKLISASFKYINFWDLEKNIFLYSIEAHNNYITCLLIINNRLFSAGDDGNIKIWE